ncbi:MAG: DUF5657 family protein [bacterium]
METIPLTGLSVWLIAKIFVLIALGLYIVFATVIVKQVNLMIKTIKVGFEAPIRFVAWGHLLFALGIFVVATIIL